MNWTAPHFPRKIHNQIYSAYFSSLLITSLAFLSLFQFAFIFSTQVPFCFLSISGSFFLLFSDVICDILIFRMFILLLLMRSTMQIYCSVIFFLITPILSFPYPITFSSFIFPSFPASICLFPTTISSFLYRWWYVRYSQSGVGCFINRQFIFA